MQRNTNILVEWFAYVGDTVPPSTINTYNCSLFGSSKLWVRETCYILVQIKVIFIFNLNKNGKPQVIWKYGNVFNPNICKKINGFFKPRAFDIDRYFSNLIVKLCYKESILEDQNCFFAKRKML